MRKLVFQIIIAITIFAGGIVVGRIWHNRKPQVSIALQSSPTPIPQGADVEPWPLTKVVVSRALQTRGFATDKLRTNSNPEIVWRWLKDSIAHYPQNWVKLDLSDEHTYGVVLYPPEVIDASELFSINRKLAGNGLPPLKSGKQYIPVQINIDNVICPDWHGFIDAEEARLAYFEGISG